MTVKNLNRITGRMVAIIIEANGYDPRTGVNGGDRELAQGELAKALKKAQHDLLKATGLTDEQIADATEKVLAAEAAEDAAEKDEKAAKKAEKAAA